MLGVNMFITIKTLWEQGYNKAQIQKITNHDWKTVDKIIKAIQAGQDVSIKKNYPCKLEKYKEQIIELLDNDLSGVRIYEKLKDLNVEISYASVKNYISKLKFNDKVCIRFHTKPGEEAQVDFGYIGLTPDNNKKMRKTWVFNMRLSYSRLDSYQKALTLN